METVNKERIVWIDIAKGIGIMLVIIGHCFYHGYLQSLFRGVIFSFHMPLFFIISGYTLSCSDSFKKLFLKTFLKFKRLIIPSLIIYLISIILESLNDWFNYGLFHPLDDIKSFLYNSLFYVGNMPFLWFLFALFFGGLLSELLLLLTHNFRTSVLFSFFLSFSGFLISSFNIQIPLSLDIILIILPFFFLGHFMSTKPTKIPILVVSLILWLTSFFAVTLFSGSYFEIYSKRFPLFPVCMITAAAGSIFVISLSYYLSRIHWVSKALSSLGKISLYVLIAHVFDFMFFYIWMLNDNIFISILLRLIIDILVGAAIYKGRQFILSALKNRSITGKRSDLV